MKYYKILILAATAMSVAGCSKSDENTATVAEELPIVELGVAKNMPVAQIKSYTATVEADNTNNISPSQPNRIKTISVEVGDRVRRGQTLVTLDRAGIDQLKLNLDDAQREYDRAAKLLEIGAGTQQQVDQLKTKLDATRSQYDNLLENTVLTSPISGVVTARNYDPGDMTGTQPVLTVGQLSPIVKVMINVSENDMRLIGRGMDVDITFDAFPGEEFSGKISRVYPTVDPATRTFPAEINIANPGERILPGMFARVSLNLGDVDNVVVPDRAVVKQSGSGNKYVYVYHSDGTVSYNKIELGRRLDTEYELLSGVASGDSVVIAGQSRLADGVKVEVKH